MPRQPLSGRALTPAERQQRRRDKLAMERKATVAARQADPLPFSPELDRLRRGIGTVARYLASMDDPTRVAVVLAGVDGPPLPYPMLHQAADWLASFAESSRYAVAAQRVSLTEMSQPPRDADPPPALARPG